MAAKSVMLKTTRQNLSVQGKPEPMRPAGAAKVRHRHVRIFLSFLLFVILPLLVAVWYLVGRAVDQYSTTVVFTVRQVDNTATVVDIIGGVTTIGQNASSETDIVYKYIQSKQLIAAVDKMVDLKSIFSRYAEIDPYFSFDNSGTIEDLVEYWPNMVSIYHDTNTGLLELQVKAFSADDAFLVAEEIVSNSASMINMLNVEALIDTTKYTRQDLDESIDKLKQARQAISTFRTENQVVNPTDDLQGQMGILATLQQRMADSLIELDLLNTITKSPDPRIDQAKRKIVVIDARIEEERAKLSSERSESGTLSSVFAEFEALKVDLEFSESVYISSLAAYDASLADARRQKTYLTAFVKPTIAERSEYPKRLTLLSLTSLFVILVWLVGVLVVYSIRDRK